VICVLISDGWDCMYKEDSICENCEYYRKNKKKKDTTREEQRRDAFYKKKNR